MMSVILNDDRGRAKLSEVALNNQNGAFANSGCHTLRMDISLCSRVAGKLLHSFGNCLLSVVGHLVYVICAIPACMQNDMNCNNDGQQREEECCILHRVVFA